MAAAEPRPVGRSVNTSYVTRIGAGLRRRPALRSRRIARHGGTRRSTRTARNAPTSSAILAVLRGSSGCSIWGTGNGLAMARPPERGSPSRPNCCPVPTRPEPPPAADRLHRRRSPDPTGRIRGRLVAARHRVHARGRGLERHPSPALEVDLHPAVRAIARDRERSVGPRPRAAREPDHHARRSRSRSITAIAVENCWQKPAFVFVRKSTIERVLAAATCSRRSGTGWCRGGGPGSPSPCRSPWPRPRSNPARVPWTRPACPGEADVDPVVDQRGVAGGSEFVAGRADDRGRHRVAIALLQGRVHERRPPRSGRTGRFARARRDPPASDRAPAASPGPGSPSPRSDGSTGRLDAVLHRECLARAQDRGLVDLGRSPLHAVERGARRAGCTSAASRSRGGPRPASAAGASSRPRRTGRSRPGPRPASRSPRPPRPEARDQDRRHDRRGERREAEPSRAAAGRRGNPAGRGGPHGPQPWIRASPSAKMTSSAATRNATP